MCGQRNGAAKRRVCQCCHLMRAPSRLGVRVRAMAQRDVQVQSSEVRHRAQGAGFAFQAQALGSGLPEYIAAVAEVRSRNR
eukprot:104302-Rhodomonas_salina.1